MNKLKLKRKTKFKIYFYIFIFLLTFVISIKYLNSINYKITNTEYLRLILNDSGFINNSDGVKNKNLIYYLVKSSINLELNPTLLFASNYKTFSSLTASDDVKPSSDSEYISDPYPATEVKDPLIYIYNTHQLEEYTSSSTSYNITPNVMMASYILREKLNDMGHMSIVEDASVEDIVDANNWNYAGSYKATRILLEKAKEKYPTLNYFIDIHRDSVNRSISTTVINKKNYAKILFIVGLENPSYQENLNLTETLNKMFEEKYPSLSRGIYKKQGSGVNGIYNQDFNKNTILIEIGGEENTIDEVLNTVIAISDIIGEYLGENI